MHIFHCSTLRNAASLPPVHIPPPPLWPLPQCTGLPMYWVDLQHPGCGQWRCCAGRTRFLLNILPWNVMCIQQVADHAQPDHLLVVESLDVIVRLDVGHEFLGEAVVDHSTIMQCCLLADVCVDFSASSTPYLARPSWSRTYTIPWSRLRQPTMPSLLTKRIMIQQK